MLSAEAPKSEEKRWADQGRNTRSQHADARVSVPPSFPSLDRVPAPWPSRLRSHSRRPTGDSREANVAFILCRPYPRRRQPCSFSFLVLALFLLDPAVQTFTSPFTRYEITLADLMVTELVSFFERLDSILLFPGMVFASSWIRRNTT
jgi:hypothetical protein